VYYDIVETTLANHC